MSETNGADDTRHFYCPCGLTAMATEPPGPDARLVVSTIRCQSCGESVQHVPTAWDQP